MEKFCQFFKGNKRWLMAVMFFTPIPQCMLAQDASGVSFVPTDTVVVNDTESVVVGDFSAVVSGKISTIYLPFGLDAVTAASWGTFYEFVELDGSTVRMAKVTRTEPNTPYLFIPATPKVSATSVTLTAPDTSSESFAMPEFEGTYVSKTIVCDDEYDYYRFTIENRKIQFVKVTDGVTVSPYCAYFKVPRLVNAAQRLSVSLDGGTTDMEEVLGADGEEDDDPALYDLKGTVVCPCYIPLPQTPTPKGVYIYHKKKLVID